MSIYRTMELKPEPKPEYVRINREVTVRRDWISHIDHDAKVWLKYNSGFVQGDPVRLHEEGLF